MNALSCLLYSWLIAFYLILYPETQKQIEQQQSPSSSTSSSSSAASASALPNSYFQKILHSLTNFRALDYFKYQNQLLEIESYRSRELKNILIQDYHLKSSIISKIIDRSELKKLLQQIILERQDALCYEVISTLGIAFLTAITICIFIYFNRKSFKKFMKWFLSLFMNKYILAQKWKLLKMCRKQKGASLGVIMMILSFCLEIGIAWIQMSIFLSWILPSDSIFRNYLFYGFISLPVGSTFNQFSKINNPVNNSPFLNGGSNNNLPKGAVSTLNSLNNQQKSSWDLDIGSMVSMGVMRWLIQYLENKSAEVYVKAQESAAFNESILEAKKNE